jgi:hypothetical protein
VLKNTRPAAAVMLVATGALIVHAAAKDQFCIVHPHSMNCENAIALGPEYPHENPEAPTKFPVNYLQVTTSSTSAVSTGAPFIGGSIRDGII